MAADDAVMRDMHVGQEAVVTADDRFIPRRSGAVNGAKLSKGIVITDFEAGGFSTVLQVLSLLSDGTIGEEAIVFTDLGRPHDGDMMLQPTAVTDLHIRPDDAIGADGHI